MTLAQSCVQSRYRLTKGINMWYINLRLCRFDLYTLWVIVMFYQKPLTICIIKRAFNYTTKEYKPTGSHTKTSWIKNELKTGQVGLGPNSFVAQGSHQGSPLKGNLCSSWLLTKLREAENAERCENPKGASTPSKDLTKFVCAYRRGVVFSTLGRPQQKDQIHRLRCINSKSHTRYVFCRFY